MPVLTRSMMAHGYNYNSLVLSSSDRSTCLTEQTMPSTTSTPDTPEPVIDLLELINQSRSSTTTIDNDDSTSSSTSTCIDDFEISNFQNYHLEFPSSVQFSIYPHNFEIDNSTKMESDCEDIDAGSIPASGSVDITKLFEQLSLQITSQNSQLCEHFLSMTQKVSTDFQKPYSR
jgi:hypothetical protein